MTIFEQAARVPRKHPYVFHGAVAALIVILSLVVYKRTFEYAYLDWDDNTLVEQNVYVMNPEKFPTEDLWTPGKTPGPYQPIRTWSYLVDREVLAKHVPDREHDRKGSYHHKVNTWLYVLNGLVLFYMLRKLLDPWTAALATLIWIAHPVHVEAVSWVSGRKEMLSGLFMVGSVAAYVSAAEGLRQAAPRVRTQVISAVLVLAGAIVAWRWIPIARALGLAGSGANSWAIGLAALAVICAGIVVAGWNESDRRLRVVGLSVLAFVLATAGLLSKPVGVVLPPILIAWEMGHRPVREKVTQWTGRTGFLVISVLLLSAAATAGAWFVKQKTPLVAAGYSLGVAAACAALAAVAFAAYRKAGAGLQEKLRALAERAVPTTQEGLGMLVRTFPYICLSLWGLFVTVQRGASSSVIKEATWNAAPKSQLVSSMAAVWLDVYHLFAPLNLSSLYDVKADEWHWQAYLGALILLSLPFAFLWIFYKSPKSLVWLAWLVFPIIPVSGIIRIAAAHADRYLYLPAIAVAVGLAYLLVTAAFGSDEETGAWERWVAAALSIAIVGGFTVLSMQRAEIWRNDVLLWGDAVKKNPNLPSALNNYGAALMNAKRVEEALQQYYRAYEVLPTLDVAQFNIAATELRLKRPDRAQKYGEEFVEQHPKMPTGWILLGQIYNAQMQAAERAGNPVLREEKLRKMEAAYEKGCTVAVSPTQPLQLNDKGTACAHLASTRHTMSNTTGADLAFDIGFQATPNNFNLFQQRARVRRAQGRLDEALADVLRLYSMRPGAETIRQVIQIYIERGELVPAREYLDILLRTSARTQNDFVLRQRLEAAIQAGDKTVDLSLRPGDPGVPTPAPR